MKLLRKGVANGVDTPLVLRIQTNPEVNSSSDILLLGDLQECAPIGSIVLSKESLRGDFKGVHAIDSLDDLNQGDIVAVYPDGIVTTLYRVNSRHNTLLMTERCNSNCLMCSQPPKDRDDVPTLFELHQKMIPLIPKSCEQLGISGGEPTLAGDKLFSLLRTIKDELPETDVHMLTNGRSFAWNRMAASLGELEMSRLVLGIPLYSDYYADHDHIVQARNAFDQTVLGLHNLDRYFQRVEVRVVLHKLSIPRLEKLARYIYRNLPFVEHIAFMGLEYVGYTPHNIKQLWIDPLDYADELTAAVFYLADKGMNVSIYNSQLCVTPEVLWPFCRKSISDWKNEYADQCGTCALLEDCGGLFRWNLKMHSRGLAPVAT